MKAFKCRICGICCRGEGGIFVEEHEIARIARFFKISPGVFQSRFCEKRHGRSSIKTGPNNACIFFREGKNCVIHPVKPDVCARWPFFTALVTDPENWKMAQDACPGINPDCSFEEFVRQSEPVRNPRFPGKDNGK